MCNSVLYIASSVKKIKNKTTRQLYWDTIHVLNNLPFKVYNSMTFSVFTELSNHNRLQTTTVCCGTLIPTPPPQILSPQEKSSFSFFLSQCPTPQPLETTNLVFVLLEFSILDISRKWDHVICAFCNWLPSHRVVFSRTIYVVDMNNLCLFVAKLQPIVWMYRIFSFIR